MSSETVVKSTQEQAVAGWIDYLNILRFSALVEKLSAQDCNLEAALRELSELKEFISHPEHILGSIYTKHGEIAEHVQVHFANAEKLIEGLKATHTFDGVGRTAMEDYLRDGIKVQSKFYLGIQGTLHAISEHLDTYPDFLKDGGCYDIAKNHFEELKRIYDTGEAGAAFLSEADGKMYEAIKAWETENNVVFPKVVRPSLVSYDDVQLDRVADTIQKEQQQLEEKDQARRDQAEVESAPSLQEGLKVTAISAAVESGFAFALGMYRKIHEGKKIQDFTADDWKDIGLDTATGAVKGGIRGGAVYTLTNFTNTPAPVASAMVTATFGIMAQANKLRKGDLTAEEFLENSEIVCLDVSVSAMCSLVGQTVIPIPILGAIIGNAAGMFMYDIGKTFLNDQEKKLFEKHCAEMKAFREALDIEQKQFMEKLETEMSRFNSLIELAFDEDTNVRFQSSIERARMANVPEAKIIKSEEECSDFFQSDTPFSF